MEQFSTLSGGDRCKRPPGRQRWRGRIPGTLWRLAVGRPNRYLLGSGSSKYLVWGTGSHCLAPSYCKLTDCDTMRHPCLATMETLCCSRLSVTLPARTLCLWNAYEYDRGPVAPGGGHARCLPTAQGQRHPRAGLPRRAVLWFRATRAPVTGGAGLYPHALGCRGGGGWQG